MSILYFRSSRKYLGANQGDTTHPLRTSSQPVTTTSSSSSSTPPVSAPSSVFSPTQAKRQQAYARTKPSTPKKLSKSPPTKPKRQRNPRQRSKEAPAVLSPKNWRSVPTRVVSKCVYMYVYITGTETFKG